MHNFGVVRVLNKHVIFSPDSPDSVGRSLPCRTLPDGVCNPVRNVLSIPATNVSDGLQTPSGKADKCPVRQVKNVSDGVANPVWQVKNVSDGVANLVRQSVPSGKVSGVANPVWQVKNVSDGVANPVRQSAPSGKVSRPASDFYERCLVILFFLRTLRI
ncbi:MAG: hypothetical protein DRI57_09090 [Deltaproteobacteria bacterium]|nr:MAG: hypothetical protein DRI57_09090 [Deltaproteobacteria bacterium]